jgi:hypothetical protein
MPNEERAHLRPEQGSWGESLIVAEEKRGVQSLGEVTVTVTDMGIRGTSVAAMRQRLPSACVQSTRHMACS